MSQHATNFRSAQWLHRASSRTAPLPVHFATQGLRPVAETVPRNTPLPTKWTSTVKVAAMRAALFGKSFDATICLSNLALQQLRGPTVCD
jgi:hypothetical protein